MRIGTFKHTIEILRELGQVEFKFHSLSDRIDLKIGKKLADVSMTWNLCKSGGNKINW